MDTYTSLARKAVVEYLLNYRLLKPPPNLPKEMLSRRAGVFVSLHHKNGSLRGCIGTYLPTQKNLAEEIIKNALSAAFRDPRFPPVTLEEIPSLVFSVDILSKPKPVPLNFPLNPKIYGLIVSSTDGRSGLLLPDIEGVDTPEDQIRICKMKAGIWQDEAVTFQIFTVTRHEE
jgi:AmmeMemoRadiSam system protein A